MHHVSEDQQFKVRQMIERFLHGRTGLEIQRAIAMTQNLREQELLAERLKQIEKAAAST